MQQRAVNLCTNIEHGRILHWERSKSISIIGLNYRKEKLPKIRSKFGRKCFLNATNYSCTVALEVVHTRG